MSKYNHYIVFRFRQIIYLIFGVCMKKLLTKILIGILAVATMLGCFAGCGSSSAWTKPTMTSWGEGNIVGGFVGEKGDYLYFINGVGVSTEDNDFGAPVKGALMVANKNDLTKSEIVVPKLFVASDYKAGLYIYGDRVYYGTPNTDKDSQGEIANYELTFMSTKLDGTDTQKYFTLDNLSAEYRIVEANGVVYIVYYNASNTALEVYNCNEKKANTICKTDVKAESESLNKASFAGNSDDAVVYFTTTVYAEAYDEDKADSRATESYNKLYAYKAKDGAFAIELIFDGADPLYPATYEVKLIKNGAVYYSETKGGATKTYKLGDDKVIVNDTVLADTTLFVGENLYTVTEGKIEQVDLYNKNANKAVAINTGATALLAVNGEDIYFTDAESGISRIKLNDQDAKIQKVTAGTAYTSWYPVQFIGSKLFYCDNSNTGASYIKYVDVAGEVKAEDTDEDGENDKFYLEGQTAIGIISESDKVSIATAKVSSISTSLSNGAFVFEKNDEGELFVEAVDEATEAVKGIDVSEDTSKLLAKYQKAIEMANLYNKLDGIRYENNNTDFESAYNQVKDQIEAFRASDDYSTISAYIGNNLLWNYQKAVELFASK